jgi:hypothetical protein
VEFELLNIKVISINFLISLEGRIIKVTIAPIAQPEKTQRITVTRIGNHISQSFILNDLIICASDKHGINRLAIISARPFATSLLIIYG